MGEIVTHPLTVELEKTAQYLGYWWRANQREFQFWDFERRVDNRNTAQVALRSVYYNLDNDHKIQLTGGEKPVELFSFSSARDYRGTSIDHLDWLRSGEALDFRHIHEHVRVGRLRTTVLYLGGIGCVNTMGIAESLAHGGKLEIVGQDVPETYDWHIRF